MNLKKEKIQEASKGRDIKILGYRFGNGKMKILLENLKNKKNKISN